MRTLKGQKREAERQVQMENARFWDILLPNEEVRPRILTENIALSQPSDAGSGGCDHDIAGTRVSCTVGAYAMLGVCHCD